MSQLILVIAYTQFTTWVCAAVLHYRLIIRLSVHEDYHIKIGDKRIEISNRRIEIGDCCIAYGQSHSTTDGATIDCMITVTSILPAKIQSIIR